MFCVIALQSIKLELPPFLCFARLHCNLLNWSYLPFFILHYCIAIHLNWSYLPFLFCVIALQSINWSYLPFIFCVIALQSIKLELPPFFYILHDCIAIY